MSTPPEGADSRSPVWRAGADARRAARKAPVRTGLRDIDASHRARLIKAATWALPGGLIGFLVGGPVLALLLWAVAFGVPVGLSAMGGRVGESLYTPSGRTTPHRKEYSFAKSLEVRGLYDEAIAAYEEAIAESPDDPIPYLQSARLARDKLSDDARAAKWFQRGLLESQMHSGLALLTVKEFVELCEVRMGEPNRAAPSLARLAAERPESDEGRWAAGELKRIKEEMASESDSA